MMIMPKYDPTQMATIYHVETGAQQVYPIDAKEILTNYPDEWKVEPWTDKEKAEFAKKPKADLAAKKETPKWRVKEPISLGGTLHNTTGQILENYCGQPHEFMEPQNDSARKRDKDYLRANDLINEQMDRAMKARDLEISKHPSNQPDHATLERIHHVPALP